MPVEVEELNSKIERGVADGQLMESSVKNIRSLLAGSTTDLYLNSVNQLADSCEWSELNDRFYQTLAFGTGGLRGRTIGKIVTTAERGKAREDERPEFPCVGTNAMNFFNINRATRGLVAYLLDWNRREGSSTKPKLVIAHDPRFFSKEFAGLAAKVAAENGCDAFVFDASRSVPELSFAVRHLHASAGIVITASHNPPHDNGYKVYFDDGAQVIEPHASGIIAKVNAITTEAFTPLPKEQQGKVTVIGKNIDQAYMYRLETLILEPRVIREAKSLRIVYTPLHGGMEKLRPSAFAHPGSQSLRRVSRTDSRDAGRPGCYVDRSSRHRIALLHVCLDDVSLDACLREMRHRSRCIGSAKPDQRHNN